MDTKLFFFGFFIIVLIKVDPFLEKKMQSIIDSPL